MRVLAYAKINLALEILGRRSDGYHEIKTILQTIDLADRLDIESAHTLRVDCDDPSLGGESNLVWLAAQQLAQHLGINPGARIYIRKRIPVGAGLGGGSSDAASALIALNQVWNAGLSLDELTSIAAGIGSDVPFFLFGGTALGEGRGDQVNRLPPLAEMPVLLVCPEQTINEKTRTLYSQITPAHYSDGGVTRRLVQTMMSGQLVVNMLYNAFESLAFQAFPGLRELHQRTGAITASRPQLSGAGPAMFCLPSSDAERQQVDKALQGCQVRTYLVNAIIPPPGENIQTHHIQN